MVVATSRATTIGVSRVMRTLGQGIHFHNSIYIAFSKYSQYKKIIIQNSERGGGVAKGNIKRKNC